jgi:hypothetical protein
VLQVGRPVLRAAATEIQAAEVILVGRITAAKTMAMGMSEPPVYSVRMTVQVGEVLRGGVEKGKELALSYQVSQQNEPTFDAEANYLLFIRPHPMTGESMVLDVMSATEEKLKEVRLVAALPVGWTLAEGKPLSPWTGTWPKDPAVAATLSVCSKTGRPAFLAGKGVTLKAEPVPPTKEIKWTNPDGDGEYKITVTNTTDKPVEVPALLSDETGIRWNESLLVFCQGKAQPPSPTTAFKGAPRATRLEPNQSISTVVNALTLKGIDWPRGGYRITFTFCLGELATAKSFYYMSRHHDPLRTRAAGPRPAGDAAQETEKTGQETKPAPRKSLAALKAEAKDSLAAAEKAAGEGNKEETLKHLEAAKKAFEAIKAQDDLRRRLRDNMEMDSLSAPANGAAPESDAAQNAEKKPEPKETVATLADKALAAVAAAEKAMTDGNKEEALKQITSARKIVTDMDAVRDASDTQKRPPRRTPLEITPN